MNLPTYLDEYPRRHARDLYALALGATPAAGVIGLRIDTDGHLSEVHLTTADPFSAVRPHLGTNADLATGGGAGVETLDRDLAMWFDLDGAEHARRNPTASVVTAMFGRPGPRFGPVIFTGTTPVPPGRAVGDLADLPVAATILLAGTARTCDPDSTAIDRAAEFARLDVDIVPAPRESLERIGALPAAGQGADPAAADAVPGCQAEVSYDALAHTVTVDGDLPWCAECQVYTSAGHPEHQPEVLAEQDSDQPR